MRSFFKPFQACLVMMVFLTGMARAETLDVNTATAQQLDKVMVGVGAVKAQAIVQDREKNGPFKSLDDLDRVKGIGKATIEKNRNLVSVGAASPQAGAPAAGVGAPPSAAKPADHAGR